MRRSRALQIVGLLLIIISGESAVADQPAASDSRSSTATPPAPVSARTIDSPVRRVQIGPGVVQRPLGPGVAPPIPVVTVPRNVAPAVGAQSISLEAALYGTLTSNPDLATLRQGNPTTPSAEAVEVARHFPTALNPTLWCDLRPIVLIPPEPFGGPAGGRRAGPFYHFGQVYFYVSLRQPVELGHQTTHRYHIARAAYEQQKWTVLQAALVASVQT